MTSQIRRRALLGTALTAVAGTFALIGGASPASAACTIVTVTNPNDTLNCTGTTTTSNFSRAYTYTSDVPQTVNIASGAVVNGYGLSFVDTAAYSGSLTANNGGTIQVDAGNTPTAGGNDAALNIVSNNTAIIYGGVGDILNLGTGEALGVRITGTGTLSANIDGSLQANNGDAIQVVSTNASGGTITISTETGQSLKATNGDGIDVDTQGSGDVMITNGADILSAAGADTLQNGIKAVSIDGTGSISIGNSGSIGATGDRAQLNGIIAVLNNATASGDISVTGSGAIHSLGNSIDAFVYGSGDITVNYSGNLDTTTGNGVEADATSGIVTVTTGGTITAAAGNGIDASSTSGDLLLTANGAITADQSGIVGNSSTGNLTVNVNANVTGTNQYGVYLGSGGTMAVNVASGATVTGGTGAIEVVGPGTATITNAGTIGTAITGAVIAGPNTAVTIDNQASGIINGNVQLSDLADTITNAGTVNLATNSMFGGGADIVTNSGTFTILGTADFGAGADVVTNNAGGTFNLANGAVVSGLETLTTAGTFNTTGTVAFDAGATTVTNTGTANLGGSVNFGAGTDALANNAGGTLNLANVTLMGLDTLSNAGTLNTSGTVTFDGGAITLANSGTANLSGTVDFAAGTDAITNSAAGTLNLNNAILLGLESISNAGTLNTSGTLTFDGGATTVTNTGTANLAGTIDFGAGADAFSNNSGSTLNLANVTLAGLDTLANAGTLNTSGTVGFDAGATTLTNTGTANLGGTVDFGAGTDAISNGVGGTLNLSAVTLNGLEAITNAGTLTTSGTVTMDAGATTLTNSGTANLAGSINFGAGADALTNNAGATLNFASGTTVAGLETLSSAGTLNTTGTLTFDGGATTLANTGTANLAGTIDFGAGTDALNNNVGGTLNVASGTTLAGLEALTNAGTATLNNVSFDGGNTTVGNSGALNMVGTIDFGAGTDSLVNQSGGQITLGSAVTLSNLEAFGNNGTLTVNAPLTFAGVATAVDNGGVINLNASSISGASAFTNQASGVLNVNGTTSIGASSFTNAGLIDLNDGAADDRLTVSGDFVGSGGTILLDVADDIADTLVIGGAASGSTTIDANLIGTGVLVAGGVLLVDAGTSSANAFTLGSVNGNTSPLLTYGLQQRDADYYLVTSVSETGLIPLPVTQLAGELWYQSADAVLAQARLPDDRAGRVGLWGQAYFGREKSGSVDRQSVNGIDFDADNKLNTDRVGLQAGVGFGLGGIGVVGLTAGIEESDSTTASSDYEAKGWNVGAYGLFGGPSGIHGSLLAKHDRFDIDLGASLFEDANPNGRSNGVDGEVGYRLGAGSGIGFDVSAGLAHVTTKIDDIEVASLTYDYGRMTSTRGRFGVRATGSGPISPFIDARVYHEFSDDHDVVLSDGIDAYRLSADGRGTWARIEAGVGGPASGVAPMVAAWVDLGDVKGVGARGSFRF